MDPENPTPAEHEVPEVFNVNVPNVGQLRTLGAVAAAQEISRAFLQREVKMASGAGAAGTVPARVRPKNIMSMMDLLSASLDLASATMEMTSTVPGRLSYSIIFKNDSDVILQPRRVQVASRYYYNKAPHIILPGETCNCMFQLYQQEVNSTGEATFSFAAISTDESRAPPGSNPLTLGVVDFDLVVNRILLVRTSMMRVRTNGFEITPAELTSTNTNLHLQYVAFAGSAANRMPSFGIAMLRTRPGNELEQSSGAVVLFTPLQDHV